MTHNFERKDWKTEMVLTAATGFLYGFTNTMTGHPLDTIKTKMQACPHHIESEGMFHTLGDVFKQEGVRGLYRGCLSPLFGSVIY